MHFLVFSSEYKVKEFEVLHPTGQTAVLLFWVPWVPLSETQTILKVINKGEGKHTTNFVVNMKLVQNRECGSVGLTLLSQSVLAVREREWVLSFYSGRLWGKGFLQSPVIAPFELSRRQKLAPPPPFRPSFSFTLLRLLKIKLSVLNVKKHHYHIRFQGL